MTNTKHILAFVGSKYDAPMALHFSKSAGGEKFRLAPVTPESFECDETGLAIFPTPEAAKIAKDALCVAAAVKERFASTHSSRLDDLCALQVRECAIA